MRRHRFELILGAVFLALLLAYCYFVSAGPKMTKEEVAGYVARIEQGVRMPEPMRREYIARVRAWGEADDGGPVYLANIFHANDAGEMAKAMWEGLDIKLAADGEKTHEIYLEAVQPLILPKGVWPAIGTRAQGLGTPDKTNIAGFYPGFDAWTEINISSPTCAWRSAVCFWSSSWRSAGSAPSAAVTEEACEGGAGHELARAVSLFCG